jgi:hypothetical protein
VHSPERYNDRQIKDLCSCADSRSPVRQQVRVKDRRVNATRQFRRPPDAENRGP